MMRSERPDSAGPTLWRTCRALANRRRLEILAELARRGELSVVQVARHLHLTRPAASQYLRALNARGLLRVRRSGRWTYYRVGADPQVAQAARLLQALEAMLHSPRRLVKRAYRAATAFTHPRRVEIVRCLAQAPLTRVQVAAETGISLPALDRHLRKLRARGVIDQDAGRWHCVRQTSPLPQILMDLAAAR